MKQQDNAFDPRDYLNQWYKGPSSDNEFYQWMKKAFDLIPQCEWGIEIGCGPILVLSTFASRKIKNQMLTEYNTQCFKYIKAWMDDDKISLDYYDWSKYFQVIAQIEGGVSGQTVSNREKESVKLCMKVDLMAKSIFEYPIFFKADVITSSLCFEAAAPTEKDYKDMVGKLRQYLKPGGYLFLLGVLEETFYMSGKQRLRCLPLTEKLVRDTLSDNHFTVLFYDQVKGPEGDPEKIGYDGKAFFGLLAKLDE